jgi:hypothetical protein
MSKSASLRPPYSQIVILDPKMRVEVPDWTKGASFVATDTCILFGCLAEIDGETQFTLGSAAEVDPGFTPIFEGKLKTPNRNIALETVEGDPVLDAPTNHELTIVRIWSNTTKEPDKVIVGID